MRASSNASKPPSYGDSFCGSGRLGDTNEPAPTIRSPRPSPNTTKRRMGKYCASTSALAPCMKHGFIVPENYVQIIGADGETRTPTAYATAPSRQRVYQFHHVGSCQPKAAPSLCSRLAHFGTSPGFDVPPVAG